MEKDRPPSPSSEDSFIHEIIDALPPGVCCAVVFLSFFFFWGAAINLLKFVAAATGKSMPPFGDGPGALVGLLGATLVSLVLWKVKTRRQ